MFFVKRFFPSVLVYGFIAMFGLVAGYGASRTTFASDGQPEVVEVGQKPKRGCGMNCSCNGSCNCTDCANGGCAAKGK